LGTGVMGTARAGERSVRERPTERVQRRDFNGFALARSLLFGPVDAETGPL